METKPKNKVVQKENNNAKKKSRAVIVICAHNDDNIIGAGGTITKYIKDGIDVITIIFSYGEMGIPWLKDSESIKTRVKESKDADKVLGATKTFYFGLKEGNFVPEVEKKKIEKKLSRIIRILRPRKIFTHSGDDPHPDHTAVNKVTMGIIEKIRYKGDVYSFDVWNPFNVRKRNLPKLVVDITDTYKSKIEAFKQHKSQLPVQWIMIPLIYARALGNGLNRGYKYAEVFIKLK